MIYAYLEPNALQPSSIPMKAVEKIGFDPSAKRKRAFSQFLKALPTPALGRGFAAKDDGNGVPGDMIELEFNDE